MTTQEQNDAFASASQKQKRVMLAQDVLALLNAGKITPTHNMAYIDTSNIFTGPSVADDIRTTVEENGFCHVCALGAFTVALALRGEKLNHTWHHAAQVLGEGFADYLEHAYESADEKEYPEQVLRTACQRILDTNGADMASARDFGPQA